MACSASCPTQDHASYGECLRSKRLSIADPTARDNNRKTYRACDDYVDARRAGLQPETTFPKDVKKAWEITERTGVPYRADKRSELPTEV